MPHFSPVYGRLVSITPMRNGNASSNCTLLFSVMSQDMGPVNFMVTPRTYVLEQETLKPGDSVIIFFDTMAPAPLIYPPQYTAVLMVKNENNTYAAFDYFGEDLANSDQTLRLNIPNHAAKNILLANGQTFFGNPGGHYLLVRYSVTTRSIPPITTPEKVIVFCSGEENV